MSSTRSAFSWISKGSAAVLENGLVSGSNFIISIFLARWLSQPQYGAFALAFSIALLLFLVHYALVLEPLSVYGGAMAASSLRPYLNSLFIVHASISG
ncbi:MAG: Membrane protein involved in the export of O-antigen and teichoic acid-like protein, partial [Acidobacteriaceae bacterium]|nr:Membrane protein involved in the export of O-antigen and teichoic acid-like protein [Acidobacteriaceae bacterium]